MTTPAYLRGTLTAAALLATAFPALAACNGGYRWSEVKDGKTVVHYTQQPPEGRPSECVQIATGTRVQVNPGETVEDANTARKPGTDGKTTAAAQPKGMQAVPEKDPEKCKQAQDTRAVLDSHARIREKDDKGEYRYLTPEEIGEQKKIASEAVGIYCE